MNNKNSNYTYLNTEQAAAVALQLYRDRRFSEAEEILSQITEPTPVSSDMYKKNGNILIELGLLKEAEQAYRTAIQINPNSGEAYNNLGNLLHVMHRSLESEQCLCKALQIMPDSAEIHNNLGNLYKELGRSIEAEQYYRKAIVLKPDFAQAYYNRGIVLTTLERFQVAEKSYRQAIALNPHYVEAYNNLGLLLMQTGRSDEAEQVYLRALACSPGKASVTFNLSLIYLMQGRMVEGFEHYESRFDCDIIQSLAMVKEQFRKLHNIKQWKKENLNGKLMLVLTEQGAGDTLMMLRYLPYLKNLGLKRLVVCCGPHLKRLVTLQNAVDEVVTSIDALPVGQIDFCCAMMSLPHLFNTSQVTIPDAVPYLAVPEEMRRKWRIRFNRIPGLKAGLVWGGNRAHSNNTIRSIPLSSFAPVAVIKGIQLVSLQKGEDAEQLKHLTWDILHWMDECDDYLDTAALVSELDLVITVDTSVAHLAGALGKPVWLLNRFGSEWRWMLDRDDSPWYPSMKIYRQKSADGWENVILRVAEDLEIMSIRALRNNGVK
jgi:Flp pilus assembly protein TadD